ncbi:MAG: D(-)-tartrate dehydratase [Delftia tsuruhatensis]|nr:MAG: D(-)-tartrate dehydratase [Delftia tsuruhatensis]
MESYLERGYSVVKMKIGGATLAEDCERIESVLKILGPGQQLAVDANGRFDLATALDYGRALGQYPLFWYEEAGDPLDYELQARLGEVYQGPMATGENLFSMQDARNLIRHGGMRPDRDWLQFDCALSYGLVEYLRTLDMLKAHGWSPSRCIPHGGHQMSLAIAAGLGLGGNESYPDLFQPYGGFPDGVKVDNGHVTLPPLPGIGFEGKADLIAEMRSADPAVGILVISAWSTEDAILAALRAGATGYVLKERDDLEVSLSIRSVLRGGAPIDPFIARRVIAELQGAAPATPESSGTESTLSARESQILRLVADGLTNREIAEQLHLSRYTVECHIKHIYRKLAVSSRTRAVNTARVRGLLG